MTQIKQDVLTVLSTVEIDGTHVTITEQLDRDLYLAVNKVLARIGGKWNRGAGAHVFDEDPTDKLNAVIECGVLDPVVKTGYYPTPPALVERMIELADLNSKQLILEPSAGQGHIADAVCSGVSQSPGNITICEILPDNINMLELKGYHNEGGFFEYASMCRAMGITFERILMNPPFENQADIDHVTAAFDILRDGGALVAIMSSGVMFRENKKTITFRENILYRYATLTEYNPVGSFKSSGTGVNTIMIKLEK